MKRTTHAILYMAVILLSNGKLNAQMSGTYSVPASFTTIAAAISSLNSVGVSGAVTIAVSAGHTETATAGGYSLTATGTALNPITFQKAGVGANPVIYAYTGTATPASAVQDGVWRLVGSDYITINGIDIVDPNNTNPATMEYGYGLFKVSVTDGCQNNTIKNCAVTLNRVNNAAGSGPAVDGSRGINMVNSTASAQITNLTITSAAGSNSNNKFYSNTIQNCNIGIALIGYAAASPFTLADVGNDVGGTSLATGNTIINFGGGGSTSAAAGVRTLAQWGLNISYNMINSNNGGGVDHPEVLRGIYVNTALSADATISNNTITVRSAGTTQILTAIENVSGATAANNAININTNLITGCTYTGATSAVFRGILSSASAASLSISNNSLVGNSSNATSGTQVLVGNSGAVTSVINMNNNSISGFTFTGVMTGICNYFNNTGGAANASLSISNNNVQNMNYPSGASNTNNLILNSAATIQQTIINNTFTNLTLNTSGAVIFISNSVILPANGIQTVNNNSIVTAFTKTRSGGTVTLFTSSAASLAGSLAYYQNNNFSNIMLPSAGATVATAMAGWVLSGGAAGGGATKNVSNNYFNNWSCGSGAVTGFNINNSGNNTTVSSNTISNIVGTSGVITGITFGAGNGQTVSTISSNVISNLTSSVTGGNVVGINILAAVVSTLDVTSNSISALASAAGDLVSGIQCAATQTVNIGKNKITDLFSGNTSCTLSGVVLSGGTNVNLKNNLIGDLRLPMGSGLNSLIGINITGGALHNVYYNSVYLNATSSGSVFGTSALFATTAASLDLRNNILINTSTPIFPGVTVVYRRSSAGLANYASSSNNNLFYAGTPSATKLIYNDGLNSSQTLANYQLFSTPMDVTSVTENPPFSSVIPTNANFLKINPSVVTQIESHGLPISGISDDCIGTVRNISTPDIGAFEGTYSLSVCSGTPAANFAVSSESVICPSGNLQLSLANSYTAAGLSYQWQASTTGSNTGYSSVPNGTTAAIVTTMTAPTWYQCVVTCSAGPATSTSAPVSVNIGAPALNSLLTQNIICDGSSANLSLSAAASSSLSYQWLYSLSGAVNTFSSIANGTTAVYADPGVTVPTWYQAIVSCTSSPSASVITSTVMVNVGTPTLTAFISPTIVCSGSAVSLSVNGGLPPDLFYQWLSSPSGTVGSFNAIAGGTTALYADPTVTAVTWYQAAVSCTSTPTVIVNTNTVQVTLYAPPVYAPLPFLENFDNTWQDRCDLRSVPVAANWSNIPSTGNSSWRRQDDGISANWLEPIWGAVTPLAGAGCANFHTWQAPSGTSGDLRVYLDLTAPGPSYLSFYYKNYDGVDSLQVLLSINGGGSFTKIGGYKLNPSWSKKIINLGVVNSPSCIVSFSATSDFGLTDLAIDSVQIKTCPTLVVASTASLICAGGSASLTASGSDNYLWSTTSTATSIAVSPTATTIYTVTTSNGLCVVSNTVQVDINPAPVITVSGSSVVCAGGTSSFVASGANSYTWSTGAISASINPTPTASVVYTVTGTGSLGCVGTNTIALNVLSSLSVSIAGPSTICAGQTVSLTGLGGATYSWNTGATTTSITDTPGSNTTYSVIGIVGSCSNTAFRTVSVNPNPTVTVSGNATVCAGQSTTLTANGGTSYSWSTGSSNASVSISPSVNTTYTVTVLNIFGCSSSITAAVVSNSLPIISVVQTATGVCPGNSATLTALGAATYSWNTGPATNTFVVSPAVNTIYTVTGVSALGCINTSTVSVTVFSLAVISISPASATVCSLSQVNFTASGASTYTWSGAGIGAAVSYTPSANSIYTVTGTSAQNCESTATVAVTTNSLPVVAISPQYATVCAQSTASFTASGANTYLWNNNTPGATLSAVATTTTTYTVTGTSAQGCSSTATAVVSTNTLPVIVATPPSVTVCVLTPVSFTAAGASTYTWNGVTNGSTITLAPTTATQYVVAGTNPQGCVSSVLIPVITNSLPVVSISPASPTLCALATVTLTASGAASYTWTGAPAGATIALTPSASTVYTVTGTGINGCIANGTVAVSANPLPPLVIAPASPSICINQSVTLTVSGGVSYNWSNGSAGPTIVVVASVTTIYTVTGTSLAGCVATKTINVFVHAAPQITITAERNIVCANEVATFTASGAATYTWTQGSVVSPVFTISAKFAGNFVFLVNATDANNCSNSNSITLQVTPCAGVHEEISDLAGISIFPNPSTGMVNVKMDFEGVSEISIKTISGQLIWNKVSDTREVAFDLSHFAKGIYFFTIRSEQGVANRKIVLD